MKQKEIIEVGKAGVAVIAALGAAAFTAKILDKKVKSSKVKTYAGSIAGAGIVLAANQVVKDKGLKMVLMAAGAGFGIYQLPFVKAKMNEYVPIEGDPSGTVHIKTPEEFRRLVHNLGMARPSTTVNGSQAGSGNKSFSDIAREYQNS